MWITKNAAINANKSAKLKLFIFTSNLHRIYGKNNILFMNDWLDLTTCVVDTKLNSSSQFLYLTSTIQYQYRIIIVIKPKLMNKHTQTQKKALFINYQVSNVSYLLLSYSYQFFGFDKIPLEGDNKLRWECSSEGMILIDRMSQMSLWRFYCSRSSFLYMRKFGGIGIIGWRLLNQ